MTALCHFLADDDLTAAEQAEVLDSADALKAKPFSLSPLAGPRSVALLFDKPTLRTQASFSAGVAELGGLPMMIDGRLAGIGERESIADTAGSSAASVPLSSGAPSPSHGSRRWRRTPACQWSTR